MDTLRLFHVGFSVIENPDIYYGKKNADFGQGFYLSDDEEFSRRWARTAPDKTTYINSYELDLTGLKVKKLSRDREWFDYIFANRRGSQDSFAEYDLIIGPIANDTIYDVMGLTTSGFLEADVALRLLLVGPAYRQIAIKTLAAKKHLKWLGAEALDGGQLQEYRDLVDAEEQAFQDAFAESLKALF